MPSWLFKEDHGDNGPVSIEAYEAMKKGQHAIAQSLLNEAAISSLFEKFTQNVDMYEHNVKQDKKHKETVSARVEGYRRLSYLATSEDDLLWHVVPVNQPNEIFAHPKMKQIFSMAAERGIGARLEIVPGLGSNSLVSFKNYWPSGLGHITLHLKAQK